VWHRTFLVRSVFCSLTCLLSIIVSCSCIYVSQGSVTTKLTCGGIFNNGFRPIANCLQNATVKKLENRIIFGEDIDNHKVKRFWGHRV